MKATLQIATIAVFTVSGLASAINAEQTGRSRAVPVQCVQPTQPTVPTPVVAPVPAPTGVPGLSAQIGSATLVDINSQKAQPRRVEVATFKKTLKVEEFPIKVPVEYKTTESYIVEETHPVQKTGTVDVMRNNYVPVTNTYQYKYCGPCGKWVTGEGTYTTVVNKPYLDKQQYAYTQNVSEQHVRQREVTRVKLEDGVDTKVVEVIEPDVDVYEFNEAITTLTYRQTTVHRVPKGK